MNLSGVKVSAKECLLPRSMTIEARNSEFESLVSQARVCFSLCIQRLPHRCTIRMSLCPNKQSAKMRSGKCAKKY